MPKSTQTVDGTTQPVVGKGTVNYGSMTLSNVLHALLFSVNLLFISAIML
jgi:hypothetical protein